MLKRRSIRILAVAGLAAWACALPEQSAPPDGGAPTGGTGNTGTGGSATGGTTTGGATTGGTATGGTATGGTATGGTTTGGSTSGGSGTGGSAGSTGGTMSGAGGAGAGGAGTGGTAGSTAGMGGTMGGAGTGGKAGTGGSTGGSVLIHRYSFEGTNATATDSIGTAHGTITGGTQSGGAVTLSGSEQYVTLPNTLLSGLTAATFEAWVSWTGTTDWQRIFDFGNNEETMGDQGEANNAAQYIFLTPRATDTAHPNCTEMTAGRPRVAITGGGPPMESCGLAPSAFPSGLTHVAVTIDSSSMALYLEGVPTGSPVTPAFALNSISYSHNWLGRSQFAADSEFAGTISEFRVYNTARTASQIRASHMAGEGSPPTQ